VYAGSAHTLVPLSDDLATSRNLLEAIDPSIMPKPGHAPTWPCKKAWRCWQERPRPGPPAADRLVAERTGTPGHRQALGGQARAC
jgi:hypothetical protein